MPAETRSRGFRAPLACTKSGRFTTAQNGCLHSDFGQASCQLTSGPHRETCADFDDVINPRSGPALPIGKYWSAGAGLPGTEARGRPAEDTGVAFERQGGQLDIFV
jgi:hypothetical protein